MATGIRESSVSKHITPLQNVYTQLMEVVLWQHMYHCYVDMLHPIALNTALMIAIYIAACLRHTCVKMQS